MLICIYLYICMYIHRIIGFYLENAHVVPLTLAFSLLMGACQMRLYRGQPDRSLDVVSCKPKLAWGLYVASNTLSTYAIPVRLWAHVFESVVTRQ